MSDNQYGFRLLSDNQYGFTLLSDNQYGFREGYSTAMALTVLVDDIATAIDKKNLYTISIFLDLEKALDTIDHHLLL